MNIQEYVYVKRLSDGAVLDIPKKDLEQTLKRGFVLVENQPEYHVSDDGNREEAETSLTCTLCDKTYKSQNAIQKHLKMHR